MKTNRLELNLPMMAADSAPLPGPMIVLNGQALDHVEAITLKASAGSLTEITIRLYGEVIGVAEVDSDQLVLEDVNQPKLFES